MSGTLVRVGILRWGLWVLGCLTNCSGKQVVTHPTAFTSQEDNGERGASFHVLVESCFRQESCHQFEDEPTFFHHGLRSYGYPGDMDASLRLWRALHKHFVSTMERLPAAIESATFLIPLLERGAVPRQLDEIASISGVLKNAQINEPDTVVRLQITTKPSAQTLELENRDVVLLARLREKQLNQILGLSVEMNKTETDDFLEWWSFHPSWAGKPAEPVSPCLGEFWIGTIEEITGQSLDPWFYNLKEKGDVRIEELAETIKFFFYLLPIHGSGKVSLLMRLSVEYGFFKPIASEMIEDGELESGAFSDKWQAARAMDYGLAGRTKLILLLCEYYARTAQDTFGYKGDAQFTSHFYAMNHPSRMIWADAVLRVDPKQAPLPFDDAIHYSKVLKALGDESSARSVLFHAFAGKQVSPLFEDRLPVINSEGEEVLLNQYRRDIDTDHFDYAFVWAAILTGFGNEKSKPGRFISLWNTLDQKTAHVSQAKGIAHSARLMKAASGLYAEKSLNSVCRDFYTIDVEEIHRFNSGAALNMIFSVLDFFCNDSISESNARETLEKLHHLYSDFMSSSRNPMDSLTSTQNSTDMFVLNISGKIIDHLHARGFLELALEETDRMIDAAKRIHEEERLNALYLHKGITLSSLGRSGEAEEAFNQVSFTDIQQMADTSADVFALSTISSMGSASASICNPQKILHLLDRIPDNSKLKNYFTAVLIRCRLSLVDSESEAIRVIENATELASRDTSDFVHSVLLMSAFELWAGGKHRKAATKLLKSTQNVFFEDSPSLALPLERLLRSIEAAADSQWGDLRRFISQSLERKNLPPFPLASAERRGAYISEVIANIFLAEIALAAFTSTKDAKFLEMAIALEDSSIARESTRQAQLRSVVEEKLAEMGASDTTGKAALALWRESESNLEMADEKIQRLIAGGNSKDKESLLNEYRIERKNALKRLAFAMESVQKVLSANANIGEKFLFRNYSRVSLDSVQSNLNKKTKIVLLRSHDNHVVLYIISHQGMWHIKRDFSQNNLRENIKKYLTALRDERPSEDRLRLGNTLYEAIAEPLIQSAHIEKGDRLIIVADDVIGDLPLETLPIAKGRVLGQDYPIGYVPSISLWKSANDKKRKWSPQPSLYVLSELSADDTEEDKKFLTKLKEVWRDLGDSSGDSEILEHGNSKVAFLQRALKKSIFTQLVIVSHAHEYGEEDTYSPYLRLGADGDYDQLGTKEIFRLPSVPDFVFLAACGTDSGKRAIGEGTDSTGRAFLISGARVVIGTRWKVKQETVMTFNRLLYMNIANGQSLTLAFSKTVNEMMADEPIENAGEWGAFILLGDDL